MEATAIKEISRLAIEAANANRINPGEFPAYPNGIQAVVIDGKVQTLEHLQHGRSRFRGTFATSALSEFATYVKTNGGGGESGTPAGFIDPKKCTAKVFLNIGKPEAPGHADWTASLALDPTAAYAALRAIDGKQLSQKQVVEFVEDWAANLDALYDADGLPVSIASALPAIRALTIKATAETTHTDKDFGASRSSLEEIEAKSKNDIPTHLVFETEPYAGFQARKFKLRVSILTGGDKPAIVLRTVSREAVEEDIAREFKTRLLEEIGAAATLTIGSFAP